MTHKLHLHYRGTSAHSTYQKHDLSEVAHWPEVAVVVFISSVRDHQLRSNATWGRERNVPSWRINRRDRFT